jgi:hypothetical protein
MGKSLGIQLANLATVFACAFAPPCWAQSTTPNTDDAQRLAIEGMSQILKALDLLIENIPQYAAPEVLENGDIIIRRLHPEDKPKPKAPRPDDDGTST